MVSAIVAHMPQRRGSDPVTGHVKVRAARKVVVRAQQANVEDAVTGRHLSAKSVRRPPDQPGRAEGGDSVVPPLPGFVGMLHSGRADLSTRAKEIVRDLDVDR